MRGAGETGEKEDEENEGDEIQRSRWGRGQDEGVDEVEDDQGQTGRGGWGCGFIGRGWSGLERVRL